MKKTVIAIGCALAVATPCLAALALKTTNTPLALHLDNGFAALLLFAMGITGLAIARRI